MVRKGEMTEQNGSNFGICEKCAYLGKNADGQFRCMCYTSSHNICGKESCPRFRDKSLPLEPLEKKTYRGQVFNTMPAHALRPSEYAVVSTRKFGDKLRGWYGGGFAKGGKTAKKSKGGKRK